jgi:branched-chain amino acid transport system permease protein
MNYVLHILTMMSIYVILGLSVNLIVGFGGKLSLCHAAFYGVGAYAYSLMVMEAGYSFWVALPFSVVFTGSLAFGIGIVALRMAGDFFALATLGFQTIVFVILYNCVSLTKGPYGIAGIPRPNLVFLTENDAIGMFLLAMIAAAIVLLLCLRLASSPFGRALQAVRDDAIAAQSIGKTPLYFTLVAFTLGGAFAAVAGSLFAVYASYIDPTSFTLDESVFVICVVIIGGAGTTRGPIIGAVLLVILPELLRFIGLPDAIAANIRQIIYGLLLILMMQFRPQGIAGRYAFD